MKVLRTPDSCFEGLPDFDYEPHYTTINADDGTPLRIHHIDEGPADAEPILLMHGNPTWSYLYRHMIPGLLKTGRRVIALDLVGCGRSDKPAQKKDYTLARYCDWLTQWLLANDLKNITLFCQDWGGIIGLHLVAHHPERFDRIIAANTGLPIGKGANQFLRVWPAVMRYAPSFPWRLAFRKVLQRQLTVKEFAAFERAPFPARKYQAGIKKFPALLTVFPDHPEVEINRETWARLKSFDKPFLTLYGDRDPVTRGYEKIIQRYVPGAQGQAHKIIEGGGHFIQEEFPDVLVEEITKFLEVNRDT
jgi:haloalkane dehalogenase